jgi:hypothetical protein
MGTKRQKLRLTPRGRKAPGIRLAPRRPLPKPAADKQPGPPPAKP